MIEKLKDKDILVINPKEKECYIKKIDIVFKNKINEIIDYINKKELLNEDSMIIGGGDKNKVKYFKIPTENMTKEESEKFIKWYNSLLDYDNNEMHYPSDFPAKH